MTNPILNPPSRRPGEIPTWQRIIWTLVPIASVGLLAWLPFTYLSSSRRRQRDTWFAIGYGAASFILLILLIFVGTDGKPATAAGAFLMVLIVTAAVWTWLETAPKRLG